MFMYYKLKHKNNSVLQTKSNDCTFEINDLKAIVKYDVA